MKIRYTRAAGFAVTVLLMVTVATVSLWQLHRVARPLRKDIPEAITAAHRLYRQDSLSQLIRYYDEVLTQSARNFAFTQNPQWQQQYGDLEPKRAAAIKEALRDGDERDREIFASIDQANLALGEMELRSMQLVQAGQAKEAAALLDSRDYWEQKAIYQKGLADYVQRNTRESEDALDVSLERSRSAHRLAEQALRIGVLWVLGAMSTGVLLSIATGVVISRAIARPPERLQDQKGLLRNIVSHIPHFVFWKDRDSVYLGCNEVFARSAGLQCPEDIVGKTDYDLVWRNEAILQTVPDIIAEVDKNRVYTWVNQAGREFFGDGVIGKEAAFYFEGEQDTYTDVQPLFNGTSDVFYVESWQRRRDGATRLLAWWCRAIKDANGNVTCVLSTARDITECKQAEEALRRSQAQLSNAMEIARLGAWELDVESGIFTFTDSFYAIFHTTAQDMGGYQMPIAEYARRFVHPEDSALVGLETRRALETDDPNYSRYLEHRMLRADGSVGHIAVRFFIVKDHRGKTIKTYGVNQDITERKQVEQKQAQLLEQLTAANQELRDFAYVVSHDLKAPLRAIQILADWLVMDYQDKLDEQGRESLRLLGSRVDRMQNLIDGVLQYSRVGRTEQTVARVALSQIVPEIIATLGVPKHISIHIENDLPTIEADPTRITQVFQNLLSNAIKYMDKPAGDIRVDGVEDHGFWKFSVSDNGPGIEKKHFERIFKLFQALAPRDSRESTGVGLTITRKIVEMYGGKIWVESEVGHGSTFFFTLPKSNTGVRDVQVRTDVAYAV
jgi:PAS domain S-box-containing protein